MVPERSVSGATCLNFRVAVGDDGGTERSLRSDTFQTLNLGRLEGIDGGTGSGVYGATYTFQMVNLGRLEG